MTYKENKNRLFVSTKTYKIESYSHNYIDFFKKLIINLNKKTLFAFC